MSPDSQLDTVFRRALTFFPTAPVTLTDAAGACFKPAGLCPASFHPPLIAVTLPASSSLPEGEFTLSAAGVDLACATTDIQNLGDHRMLIAAVRRVDLRSAPPLVTWRRASFHLRLDYPFLESAGALEDFVNRWLTGVLPKSEWTHAAHVAVTGYFAFDRPPETVFADMKRGILQYAVHAGIVNGPDSGYHETLTHFWSDTITRAVHRAGPESRLDAARCAVQTFGEDRDLTALFYSFDVVRDRRARREWLPPDCEPLSEWLGC